MENVIEIHDGVTRHPLYRMREPINLEIGEGEQIAIVGPNGSGKTLLVDTLIGRYPLLMNEVHYKFPHSFSDLVSDNIKYIAFRDSYGDGDTNTYYQQRWNMHDQDGIPTVRELLPSFPDDELKTLLFRLFEVELVLDKPVVQLSSGEMRKFQLAKVMMTRPHVLILDNPFIGLDGETRVMLEELLARLIAEIGLQVILVLSDSVEIPTFITHIVPVHDRICGTKTERSAFMLSEPKSLSVGLSDEKRKLLLELPMKPLCYQSQEIVKLNKVSIQYGSRVILKDLDWTVLNGERWALMGKNGSGKSTLLSLVCADSPQSYACDIALFGRKRGTGESIWEIKKHIGYVSPEMHRSYLKNLPAIDIVASGLHDSIGLYRKVHDSDRNFCRWWMDLFGIAGLEQRDFTKLSSGEQRMVLLARAFVKDPDLLVLDEPMHGLDATNKSLVKDIIETFCQREGKTLIMVTHYPDELPSTITDSLILNRH